MQKLIMFDEWEAERIAEMTNADATGCRITFDKQQAQYMRGFVSAFRELNRPKAIKGPISAAVGYRPITWCAYHCNYLLVCRGGFYDATITRSPTTVQIGTTRFHAHPISPGTWKILKGIEVRHKKMSGAKADGITPAGATKLRRELDITVHELLNKRKCLTIATAHEDGPSMVGWDSPTATRNFKKACGFTLAAWNKRVENSLDDFMEIVRQRRDER